MNSEGAEIKLDMDGFHSRSSLLRFIQRNWWFPFQFDWPFGRLHVRRVNVRRTSDGFHVRIPVRNKITNEALIFLQRSLGSDVKRECFNWRRIAEIKTMRVWNVLYREKFNGRGDFIMHEKPDTRTARKIAALIRGFQKGVRFS